MNDEALLYLNAYCERASAIGWLAEPLNLVTNLAFLVAAVLALRQFEQSQMLSWHRHWDVLLLIFCLVMIGVGSGLWHFLAVPWSLLTDLIPILLFINLYLLSFLARVVTLRWFWVAVLWILYQGANYAVYTIFPADVLNGSLFYVSTWLALGLMTSWLAWRRHIMARDFIAGLGIWTLSLIVRTIDLEICSTIPSGTHFLWHVLNAITLLILLKSLITYAQREATYNLGD